MSEWVCWLKERAQENWVLNVCWQNVKPASLDYRTGDENTLFSSHVNKHISFNSLSVRTVRRWAGGWVGLGWFSIRRRCHATVPDLSAMQNGGPLQQNPPSLLQILTGCHGGTGEGSELRTQRTWKWHPAVKSIQGCSGASQVLKINQCHDCGSRRQVPYPSRRAVA